MTIQSISNGRPTSPQTEKYVAAVSEMKPGDVINHQQLEKLFDVKYGSDRYRTLVGAGNKRVLAELGIAMIAVRGVGYEKPTGDKQVANGLCSLKSVGRRIRVSRKKIEMVTDDRLPDQVSRERRDHALMKFHYLEQIARGTAKEFLPRIPRLGSE